MHQTSARGLLQASVTVLALVIIFSIIGENSVSCFEFSGYCEKMCKYGRGGNLCKCSAVHFAGKRQDENVMDGGLGQAYRLVPGPNPIMQLTEQQKSRIADFVSSDHASENSNENWLHDVDRSNELRQRLNMNPQLKDKLNGYLNMPRRRRQAMMQREN